MMNLDVVLFALRVLSGVALLLFAGSLFYVLWRDYQIISHSTQLNRHSFGRLIVLREVDRMIIETGEVQSLLPLTSIGRAPTNTIVIDDHFASSEHALIAMRNGQWWLEDRNSRNGTMLNDEQVRSPIIITNQDVIAIGSHRFRIEID